LATEDCQPQCLPIKRGVIVSETPSNPNESSPNPTHAVPRVCRGAHRSQPASVPLHSSSFARINTKHVPGQYQGLFSSQQLRVPNQSRQAALTSVYGGRPPALSWALLLLLKVTTFARILYFIAWVFAPLRKDGCVLNSYATSTSSQVAAPAPCVLVAQTVGHDPISLLVVPIHPHLRRGTLGLI
jgi:hypothetical protein